MRRTPVAVKVVCGCSVCGHFYLDLGSRSPSSHSVDGEANNHDITKGFTFTGVLNTDKEEPDEISS